MSTNLPAQVSVLEGEDALAAVRSADSSVIVVALSKRQGRGDNAESCRKVVKARYSIPKFRAAFVAAMFTAILALLNWLPGSPLTEFFSAPWIESTRLQEERLLEVQDKEIDTRKKAVEAALLKEFGKENFERFLQDQEQRLAPRRSLWERVRENTVTRSNDITQHFSDQGNDVSIMLNFLAKSTNNKKQLEGEQGNIRDELLILNADYGAIREFSQKLEKRVTDGAIDQLVYWLVAFLITSGALYLWFAFRETSDGDWVEFLSTGPGLKCIVDRLQGIAISEIPIEKLQEVIAIKDVSGIRKIFLSENLSPQISAKVVQSIADQLVERGVLRPAPVKFGHYLFVDGRERDFASEVPMRRATTT